MSNDNISNNNNNEISNINCNKNKNNNNNNNNNNNEIGDRSCYSNTNSIIIKSTLNYYLGPIVASGKTSNKAVSSCYG